MAKDKTKYYLLDKRYGHLSKLNLNNIRETAIEMIAKGEVAVLEDVSIKDLASRLPKFKDSLLEVEEKIRKAEEALQKKNRLKEVKKAQAWLIRYQKSELKMMEKADKARAVLAQAEKDGIY